jgi:hypothetical protein
MYFWIGTALFAILILPPLMFALNERRTRRRERELGIRRKQKHRL